MSALGLGVGELLRRDRRCHERGQGEIGDGEAVAHEVPAGLELCLEAPAGGPNLVAGQVDVSRSDRQVSDETAPDRGEQRARDKATNRARSGTKAPSVSFALGSM